MGQLCDLFVKRIRGKDACGSFENQSKLPHGFLIRLAAGQHRFAFFFFVAQGC